MSVDKILAEVSALQEELAKMEELRVELAKAKESEASAIDAAARAEGDANKFRQELMVALEENTRFKRIVSKVATLVVTEGQ